MPKRPCSLAVTDNDSTIICADKFGDVYSLPLLPSDCQPTKLVLATQNSAKSFTPAANEFTIHSQRNLKALENQRRQTNKAPEKSEPSFEHEVLLGHVSMLTDLALVSLGSRNYIITADRDEHIRVSRGIPQTHVIEGFCLGQTEFISRIAVPTDRPQILVSGGGDDDLFVWEWESGTLASRTALKKHVAAVLGKGAESMATEDTLKIAVSGIYFTKQDIGVATEDLCVVTCEG